MGYVRPFHRVWSFLLLITILSGAFPGTSAPMVRASGPLSPGTPPAPCALYPIALHTATLAGQPAGALLPDMLNGARAGQFGWLSWNGRPDAPTLAASLTPPGNSTTYVNPDDATD